MANETSRIKDLTPSDTVSDSDILVVDGENGTKGITFNDLCEVLTDKYVAGVWEIQQYLHI